LTERPHVCRTWAPRGQTPVLQHHFNWKNLAAIAGITYRNFYFRLYPGSIRWPQVIDFLRHLQAHLPDRLLIIWDGLAAHRSRKVQAHVEAQKGRIHLARLPAYAPELNPVEYLWGYWKQHGLPNFCAKDFQHLTRTARRALFRAQRKPTLVTAFWEQAELSF